MRRLGVRVPYGAPNKTDTQMGVCFVFCLKGTRTREGTSVTREGLVDLRVASGPKATESGAKDVAGNRI